MKVMRTLCTTIMLLTGLLMGLSAEVRHHVVQPGQTLYSISKAYGVTIEALKAANPNLEETSVPTGAKLIIPEATMEPVSMPTVPEAQVHGSTTPAAAATSRSEWESNDDAHWTDGVLTMAVIMPFNLDAESTADNKTQMRSVEFYEGVLMAVDKMQQKGRRVNVQAYDLSTESLYTILSNPQLQQADFVIAPMEENDVRQVATWSETSGTPVVSPFGFNNGMMGTFAHLYQVNTPKSMLYDAISDEILDRFKDYTVVFVSDSVGNRKADPYPALLKERLSKNHRSYHELSYLSPARLMACDSILGLKDENVLFVPVTPQAEAMRRMFSGLQHVKILRDARHEEALAKTPLHVPEMPKMAILGYPEWVLNTSDFINYYYDLNVYMFTKVYANPFDPELKDFYTAFRQWYGKEPMSLVPKYALLGYDVADTFLQALSHHGRHIEERISDELHDGLQTSFCFDHTNKGAYNRSCYLVHFTPESTIEKIVVK